LQEKKLEKIWERDCKRESKSESLEMREKYCALRQDQVCGCKKKVLAKRDRVYGYEERKSEWLKKRKFAKEKGNASF
jgi:hypothetical protein